MVGNGIGGYGLKKLGERGHVKKRAGNTIISVGDIPGIRFEGQWQRDDYDQRCKKTTGFCQGGGVVQRK